LNPGRREIIFAVSVETKSIRIVYIVLIAEKKFRNRKQK